jgi:hypothetical protein
MGLAERRRISAIKETIPTFQQEFQSVTGLQVPIDFDVTSIPEDSGVLDGYDYYKDSLFPLVTRVFQSIAGDDLGKEAVNEKIKSIKMVNVSTDGNTPGTKDLLLNSDGELLIKYGITYYSGDVWSEDTLKEKIENML